MPIYCFDLTRCAWFLKRIFEFFPEQVSYRPDEASAYFLCTLLGSKLVINDHCSDGHGEMNVRISLFTGVYSERHCAFICRDVIVMYAIRKYELSRRSNSFSMLVA